MPPIELRRLAGGRGVEHGGVGELHADEVKRPLGRRTARRESGHAAAGVEPHAAVAKELAVGHERERHARARRGVRRLERREVDVGQRVAVDDQEVVGADDRPGETRSAGAPEDARLPRIAHAGAEIAPVADDGRERVRDDGAGSARGRSRRAPRARG